MITKPAPVSVVNSVPGFGSGRVVRFRVARPSASSFVAPLDEAVEPFRSRAPRMTDALVGVVAVTIIAFSPFTLE